ncbi:TPA: hypothetical protein HA246_06375 [Candidatus Woesearchaeota archaeon]|nr:hypothetical protein [Candidatus Woesearchaeota archaeon]
MLYVNDYIYEITLVKDKNTVFEQLKNNLRKDKDWLDKKIKEWQKVTSRLNKLIVMIDENISAYDNKQLALLYKDQVNSLADSWSYPIMGEGCDPFSTNRLILQIQGELKVSSQEAREIALTLTKSKVKSFLDEEKLGLLRLALLKKQKSLKFSLELKKHTAEYHWIKNNYLETQVLEEEFFLEEIDELCKSSIAEIKNKLHELENYDSVVKKQKSALYKKYDLGKRFSEGLQLSISILEKMAWWIDQRKIVMLHGFHAIFKILNNICKRFKDTPYILHDMKYATDFEIYTLLAEDKQIDRKLLAERRKFGLHALDATEEWTYLSGKEAKEVYKVFMQKFASTEIKGLTASVGKENKNLIGEVNVVSNVNKEHFKPGSILVTSMTRPEFVSLMRKAAAIITDEGGITCHAAIVSRELGIPCIIGTKVATKILKTGDRIEVDVKTGVVRKI